MGVTEWRRPLGFEQYARAFEENHVRHDLLPSLTADDLKDLGIASVGHRRGLLAGTQGARASLPDRKVGSCRLTENFKYF